ncbi:cell wall metabolism sensor histidine kinase WalK [Paenibacillus sp. J22TS3]|uniref:sensor histidine kinase n=1 Tax=Paenibacillus sp. J22TS3 TaxID=2807192 RepID=UPI001B12D2DE|nr:HAMP domain-containing sensor histidine kinase [Paenibacillus sp. J22TS3]GIP22073.1 two-component sensor histidine kinase [Paenibacillus sp. J22TS3]
MKKDLMVYLLLLQGGGLLAILLFFFLDPSIMSPFAVGVLSAVLLGITLILLVNRCRLSTRLERMQADLRRAAQGSLNARLLTNGEPLLDELVFAINGLITQLADQQIYTVRSEAQRKRLLTNISHDIRTPLTSIIGYIDALKDQIPASEEERQEYVQVISRKAGALKELIDEIFHMAKLDADEVPLKPELIDLAELAREAVIEFLPELRQLHVELEASIPEEACVIYADTLSMQRVIRNLIKNALQYGMSGGVLGVTLTAAPQEIRLCIWDRGPGISPEDLPHLFERLYRVDRSRTRVSGGSGLGLSIAKALVEKNGGQIALESEPGRMTAVHLSFPVGLRSGS